MREVLRRHPVGHVVLPAARVDLDAQPARLAHVQVGDLVHAVDAGTELDRGVGAEEDVGRALDVEPLVDAEGDVVDAPAAVRRVGYERAGRGWSGWPWW